MRKPGIIWIVLHNPFDQKFFKPQQKIVAGSAFALCLRMIVPHPSCGYAIENTGNFLHVPLSGAGSDVLVAWLTISTTPVLCSNPLILVKASRPF